MTINFSNAAVVCGLLVAVSANKDGDAPAHSPPKQRKLPQKLAINGHPHISSNAAHLNQEDCTDAEGWYDSFGPLYDCDYYAEGSNCQLFGSDFENFGFTANEACCVCGGGNVGDTTPPAPEEGTCEDVPGWHDSDGADFDCDWYEETEGACEEYGAEFENFGFTANEACCVCGGGNVDEDDGDDTDTGGEDIVYGLQPSCNSVDNTKYNMCLDLESLSDSYRPWMEAFAKAKDKWQSTIVGNLPSIASSQLQSGPEFTCTGYPSTVDDVYICGQEMNIDGPSGVLGSAGPIYTRGSGEINPRTGEEYRVTLTGRMFFDAADIEMLENSGSFDEVVFHEMGHVLGIGSLWVSNGLHSPGSAEYASGSRAEQEWNAIGCSGPLPVETDGGQGTAGGHWDETCLQHEVMSGFLSGPSQPLSRITVGSFEDMGYQVIFGATDPYGTSDLGSCGSFCPAARRGLRQNSVRRTNHVELGEDDMNAVMRFAKMELTKIRQEVKAGMEGQEDNNGIRAAEDINVLYQDGQGKIHAVHVNAKQIQHI